jgi:glycosyltransferase involved in cell wall biosynthesis
LAVAYNGVDDAFFEAWPAEQQAHLRQSLGLPARYWLFHGNTAPKKNALGMLQAYARYRAQSQEAWPLVLTEIDAQALDPWLAATGLQALRPHLHPVGYVAHGQLPGLYQSAEGFLYPSLRESFGLPVVEAMAGGTPVIASNRSAIPEIAGEAALLVTPDTPDDIARAMLAVQHDGQKAGALRRLGPQRAQCFQWRYTAEEMLAQYRLAAGQAATLPTLY